MVFQKVGKGEKRLLTSLDSSSPRTSYDAANNVNANSNTSNTINSHNTTFDKVDALTKYTNLTPSIARGSDDPAVVGDHHDDESGEARSHISTATNKQDILHIRLRDEANKRAEGTTTKTSGHSSPSLSSSPLSSNSSPRKSSIGTSRQESMTTGVMPSTVTGGSGNDNKRGSISSFSPSSPYTSGKYDSIFRATGLSDEPVQDETSSLIGKQQQQQQDLSMNVSRKSTVGRTAGTPTKPTLAGSPPTTTHSRITPSNSLNRGPQVPNPSSTTTNPTTPTSPPSIL